MKDSGKVLDLVPLLRVKRAAECKHATVNVSNNEASATCDDCGAEIDPWLLLREITRHWDECQKRVDAQIAATLADGNAKIAELNRYLVRLTADVNELIERKNRLINEPVNGRRLGSHRKTRAR